jgi:multiple sugar transport system permease protein
MTTIAMEKNRMFPNRKSRFSKPIKYSLRQAGLVLLLILSSVIFLFPLYWMLITAFKTKGDILHFPPTLWPNPITLENFKNAFSELPFNRFFLNSFVIVLLNTVGTVISSSLIGYGFARYRAFGSKVLFVIVLATMALPGEVTLIPVFLLFNKFGWINTILPLVVPAFFGNSYFIFLFRQFFRGLHPDLLDAAKIDGASEFGIFWHVAVPLSLPVFSTVTIFNFLWTWNDFFSPLIYLQKMERMTVAVGLAYFRGESQTDWGAMMAASLVAMIPVVVLFLIAQKRITQGIMTTGLKG